MRSKLGRCGMLWPEFSIVQNLAHCWAIVARSRPSLGRGPFPKLAPEATSLLQLRSTPGDHFWGWYWPARGRRRSLKPRRIQSKSLRSRRRRPLCCGADWGGTQWTVHDSARASASLGECWRPPFQKWVSSAGVKRVRFPSLAGSIRGSRALAPQRNFRDLGAHLLRSAEAAMGRQVFVGSAGARASQRNGWRLRRPATASLVRAAWRGPVEPRLAPMDTSWAAAVGFVRESVAAVTRALLLAHGAQN